MTEKKNECTNRSIGLHLHAYEISALNEEMTEEFEIHLISCPYCFEAVSNFDSSIEALKSIEFSKQHTRKVHFWKQYPIHTAIVALFFVIMIYPTVIGIKSILTSKVEPLESITLVPVRSADKEYTLSHDNDLVLSLVYTDSKPNYNYTIEIYKNDNHLLTFKSFDDFDQYHTGRLLIPKETLVSGNYLCILKDNENEDGKILQQYTFRIN